MRPSIRPHLLFNEPLQIRFFPRGSLDTCPLALRRRLLAAHVRVLNLHTTIHVCVCVCARARATSEPPA